MKQYWDIAKKKVIDYVTVNWNSDSIFDKGKIIAIGVVLFLSCGKSYTLYLYES